MNASLKRMTFIEKLLHKRLLLLFWFSVIIVISIIPGEKLPESRFDKVEGLDKLIHSFIYAVLTFLLCLNFYWSLCKKSRIWTILLILGATAFGVLMEGFQYTFPSLGRSFEIMDIVFNFFGAVIGFGLFILYKLKI